MTAVDVDADLTLALDGSTVTVRGFGDLVVVEAPSLSTLRRLAGAGPDLPPPQRDALSALVDRADVTLDVRVRGWSVARVGPAVAPGPLSRWLGVAPARLSLGGVVLAALGRR